MHFANLPVPQKSIDKSFECIALMTFPHLANPALLKIFCSSPTHFASPRWMTIPFAMYLTQVESKIYLQLACQMVVM